MDIDENESICSSHCGDEGLEGAQFGSVGVIAERGKAVSDVGVKFLKSNETLHHQDLKMVTCDGPENVLSPTRVVDNAGSGGNLFSVGNGNVSSEVNGKPEFDVSDLVWGKVKSYPWWPGQICDPSTSSELAKKCFKKGSYLIAYFGDHTFSWNEAPRIKPFLEHFPEMEKQSTRAGFKEAVDCALDELSRRVVFSLACSCLSKKMYAKLKTQMIISAGIRKEASRRDGGDSTLSTTSFEPVNLIKLVKEMAQFPYSKVNRLESMKSQAQLSAFCCWKIYSQLPLPEKNGANFCLLGEKYQWDDVCDNASPIIEDEKLVRKPVRRSNSLHKGKDMSGGSMTSIKKKKSLSVLKAQKDLFSMSEDESKREAGGEMAFQSPFWEGNEHDAKAGEDEHPVIEDDKLVSKSKSKNNLLRKCEHISGESAILREEVKNLSVLKGEKYLSAPVSENESEGKCDSELISQTSSKKRKEVDVVADDSAVKKWITDTSRLTGNNSNEQPLLGLADYYKRFHRIER